MKKVLVAAVVLVLYAALAFAKFDPAFTWSTLQTPHFSIHYHQGGEEIAKRAAVIAEDSHDRLVPRIKWEPRGRTHIVLVDSVDATNGLTTPFPYNHIILYITPPVGEPGFGTTAYDEWMRLLIIHEYTHVLHTDMVNGGLGGVLRTVFGRLYFPNMLEPIWMIEGLATYEETELSSGGRGRSPGSEMVIRTAVLENRFPQLSQAAVFPDFWPAGEVPYLFGEGFSRFIAGKYGREKLAEISVVYSGRGFPWLVGSTGRRVLKQEYSYLWDEWRDDLRHRYGRIRDAVTSRGLTASSPLTRRGYHNGFPAFSPDGTRIAYAVSNADEFPGLYLMNSDGTGDRKLVNNMTSSTSSGGSLAWSLDGNRIYYTKIEVRKNANLYNDIYYYDLKKRREVRVTKGLRARDPHPSPDGTKLVFVANSLGRTRLGTLDISRGRRRPAREKDVAWLTAESGNQYETPRYSPDGALIVVGVWQPGGCKDIWILDASGAKIEELMRDKAIDGGAVWSPDGKAVYFASDRSGIFNLYIYDLATKGVSRITNVLGGAFSPAPAPDGKTLAFVSYSSQGYDLHLLKLDASAANPAEPFVDPYPVVTYKDLPVETRKKSYNPLPTLLPRFWLPQYASNDSSRDLFGFLTYGQDAVERHAYVLSGLYSPTTYRTWYNAGYAYDGFYPTVVAAANDMDAVFSSLLVNRNYVERQKTLDTSLIFPFIRTGHQHALSFGYRRREISSLTQFPLGYRGLVPAEGLQVSGRASYQFNTAIQPGNAISPESGRTVGLGYEQIDKGLGSDFTIRKYTADWHEYIDFPWKHHVLLGRVFAGTSEGDVIPQRAFQLGGDNPGDILYPVDQLAVFLRGYPVNEFRGGKAALGSLEYRFPVADLQSGIGSGPFYFRRFHGAAFAESGNAWDRGFHIREFKSSVGAEGRIDFYFSYYVPVTFRIGLVRALDQPRETMLILNFWMPALF